MLVFQFDNPHVEAFDFFEGDQVYFSQKLNDPGLVAVHSRIIAVAVAGDALGSIGRCGCVLIGPVRFRRAF